jgi:hypothetical protein
MSQSQAEADLTAKLFLLAITVSNWTPTKAEPKAIPPIRNHDGELQSSCFFFDWTVSYATL